MKKSEKGKETETESRRKRRRVEDDEEDDDYKGRHRRVGGHL